MWSKIAEEMAIPWRAAEAMHWQIGEHDMARRAGVTPFSLTLTNTNNGSTHNNHGSSTSSSTGGNPSIQQNGHARAHRHNMSISRSSLGGAADGSEYTHGRLLGSGIAGGQQLPSLAELTAGLPAFHHPSIHPLLPTQHGLGLSSLPPGATTGSGGGGGSSTSNGNNAYSYTHHTPSHTAHTSGHGHHSRGHSLSLSSSHHPHHGDTRTPLPGTPYSSGLPYPGHAHGLIGHGLAPSPVRGGVGADFFLKRS